MTIGAVILILVMTWICVVGTDVSAKLQNVLVILQVLALGIFIVAALVLALEGDGMEGAPTISCRG